MSVVQRLAAFVRDTDAALLPEAVNKEVLRACFNWLGCAVGGSDRPAVVAALGALEVTGGTGRSSILGHDRRVDPVSAAFANGLSSSVDAFDDTDAVMMLHPTSPVASAAFATAEHVGASGRQFLDAVLVGMEIEYRLCTMLALPPARLHTGLYLSGLTGVVGAAAAVARLLRLPEDRIAWAMGIACVAASGQQDGLSTMCCPFVPANAARNGVMAGLLARSGFDASPSAIEGPRGFANAFAASPDPAVVTDGLGKRFALMSLTYKPYPCGIVVHPALDAAIAISQEPDFEAGEVASVVARVSPTTVVLMGNKPDPRTTLEAQVSAHHWIAAALAEGRAGIEQSGTAAVLNPTIARLRERVQLVPSEAVARDAVELTVCLTRGRVFEQRVLHSRGSLENPMTDRDLEAKFRDYAGRIVGSERVERLIDAGWRCPSLVDMDVIAPLAARIS